MMPQPFVLAVPHGWTGIDPIVPVAAPCEVQADQPGLWLHPRTLIVEFAPQGIAIGALFWDGSLAKAEDVAQRLSARGSLTEVAEAIVQSYWGAYFAILRDGRSGGISVLADPSGLMPIYRLATASHILLSSDPLLFEAAGASGVAVSWSDLRAHLVRPDLRRRATCVAGVDTLVPGALVALTGMQAEVAIWRPDAFIPRGKTPTFGDAADMLRLCARETIGAWAQLAGPVVVAASGGVDSSLICAALADSGKTFTCMTLATADPSCDERAFVRTLADHLGTQWSAATYNADDIALMRPASAGLAHPARKTFMQALDAALDRGRHNFGAAAIFDGNGGDNLFCFLHSAAPVLDALKTSGPRVAIRALIDMCGVTGCDLATMAKAVGRRTLHGRRRSGFEPDLRLLSLGWQGEPDLDPWTPWFDTDLGRHSGKRDHLDLLIRTQNRVHGLGGIAVARFSPLLSQPLVELCLSLPTWLWCHGGINRAIARAAFADRLPLALRRRTSKAGPDSFIRAMFAAKRSQIREVLMEGQLASQGIVDRRAVEAALKTDVMSGDAIVYRLLDLVEAEAWAQSWRR